MTVPVGPLEPGGVLTTSAVKVTDWPGAAGLAEDDKAVEVAALFTVWMSVSALLVRLLVSP